MANLRDVTKRVNERAKHKLARGSLDLALPVYDGAYGARYGVLDGERLAEFEQLGTREYTADEALETSAEFVSDACRQLLARSDDGQTWEPLTHEDGQPVKFDEDFAEALELELPGGRKIDSAAAVALACWTVEEADGALAVNGAALNTYALRLLTWMQDTTQRVEGELAGGSKATRP